MPYDRLPLFPLPLVLFPGTPLPLHVFEPRYREMLADCLDSDQRFGLVNLPQDTAEIELPPGRVGCIAEILQSEPLADGRSNIVVRGLDRFALVEIVPPEKPYHIAHVEPYADEPEYGNDLDALASRMKDMFEVVGRAARTLADDSDPLPELPDDPPMLSFAIAAVLDLDVDARQRILESRSPVGRLRDLERLLAPALPALVARADVHKRAKSNGKGTHAQP